MEHFNYFITNYGAIAFFTLMFADSLFLPIPSQSILFITSLAAARGNSSLSVLLIASFLGTMCGSCFAYWLGRIGGHTFLNKIYKIAKIKPKYVHKFEDLMLRKGAYFILIARFIYGVRRIYAIISGSIPMPFSKFFVASLLGALIWLFSFSICPYVVVKLFS